MFSYFVLQKSHYSGLNMTQKVETSYTAVSKINLGRVQSREIKALFKLKHLNLVKVVEAESM